MMPLNPEKLIIPDLNASIDPDRIMIPDLSPQPEQDAPDDGFVMGHVKNIISGGKRVAGDVMRGLGVEMKDQAYRSLRRGAESDDAWYSMQLSMMSAVDRARVHGLASEIESAGIGVDNRKALRDSIDSVMNEKAQHAIDAAESLEKAAQSKAFGPLPGYEHPTGFISAVEQGIGQQAARLPLMLLAPWAAVPEMYLEISGATYQHLKENGVEDERARLASRLDAVAQAPLEFLGDLVAVKAILKPQAWKNLVRGIARTAGTEGLEEFAQQYPDELVTYWAMNPDASSKDIMKHLASSQVLGEAIYAAGVGAATGGILAGAGGMTHAGLEKYVTQKQKDKVEERKQVLLGAMAKARVGEALSEEEQGMLDAVTDAMPEEVIRKIQYQTPIITDSREDARTGMLSIMNGDEAKTDNIMSILDSIAHSYGDLLGVDPEQFYEKELKVGGKVDFDALNIEDNRIAAQHQKPMGATYWNDAGRAVIYGFEGANISTPIHEVGHVLNGLIERYDPSSFQKIQSWLKIDPERSAQGSASWTTQEHEKFAKGFEAYMMEGRAPSFRLIPVFKRMKAWLLEIYRKIRKLDVNLNEDVRQVFDRWLTTEDERQSDFIRDASNWYDADQAPHPMGNLSPDDYQDYDDIAAKASEIAAAKVGDMRRRQDAKARDQLWSMARKTVEDNPFWQDIAYLHSVGGLNIERIKRMRNWSKDEMKVFREWGIVSASSAVGPDEFAHTRAMLGGRPYDRAEEFLDMVLASPKKKDAIIAEYDRLYEGFEHWKTEEGPNLGDVADILDAEIAILNALMGSTPAASRALIREIGDVENLTFEEVQALKKQFKDLDRAAREAFGEGARRTREESKDQARILKEKLTGQIGELKGKAKQEMADLRAKQKERIAAIRAKNIEKALKIKEQQRIVIAKLRERQRIQKEKAKIQRRMKRILKFKNQSYEARYQLQRLLKGYFPVKGFKADPSQPELSTYLKREMPLDGGQEVLDGLLDLLPVPWRSDDGRVIQRGMRSLEDLQAIATLADIIHGMDKMKQEEIRSDKAAKFQALAEGVYQAHGLEPREQKTISYRNTWMEKAAQGKDTFIAELTKVEFLCNYLDHLDLVGPVWNAIFKPLADAENEKMVMLRKYMKDLHKIMDPVAKDLSWSRQRLAVEGYSEELTREQMFLIALNSGNEGNRRDLVEANKIPEEVIDRICNEILTEKEMKAVRQIWSLLDSLFPGLDEVNKKLLGFPLKKVEGHYFPIVHDRKLSLWAAKAEDQNAMPGDGMAPFYMAYPKAGHREARTGTVRPLKIDDIEIVSRHIHQAIHDITHTIPVIEVYRTITDDNMRRMIVDVAGAEMYEQLTPWLKNISRPNVEPRSIMENIAKGLRKNTTIVFLGLKATTQALQLSALTQTVEELGSMETGEAVLRMASNPVGMVREINEKSIMMRFRGKMYDREFNDFAQQISMGTISKWGERIGEMVLSPISVLDLCAAYPTWMAGYQKALGMFKDEQGQPLEEKCIDYADSVVRRTQSAAGPKDLATIQQGNEFKKWAAMFYTFFSVYWNKVNEGHKRAGIEGLTNPMTHIHLLRSFIYLTAIPTILSFIVTKGRLPEDDEWWKEMIAYRIGGWPIIRDLVSPALSGYDYEFSPAAGGLSAAAEFIKDVDRARSKWLDGEDISAGELAKDALWAAGYAYGLPVSQAIISMDGMIKLWNDETDNPLRLFFREPRESEEE